MKYRGSKNRYAKYLLPIILKNRREFQYYVEPFVGGGNIIDKVTGNRIGNDSNKYVIALLRAVQDGWEPPSDVSEEEYRAIRTNKDNYPDYLVGFVGIGSAYGGKWFSGYARSDGRNHTDESRRNLLKQRLGLIGAQLHAGDYRNFYIPPKSIIYCDPPYAGTEKYMDHTLDHESFWQWCDSMVAAGHTVYVSEYDAPSDWECVWDKTVFSSLTKDTGSKTAIERLFTKVSPNE